MAWRWSHLLKDYVDGKTGKRLPGGRRMSLVQASIDATRDGTDELAAQFAAGEINGAQFRKEMRDLLKLEYIRQYLLGRGGRQMMSAVDWGSIGGMLAEQYKYLDGFVSDLEGMSETGIKARASRPSHRHSMNGDGDKFRAAMYVNSARESYFRGMSRGFGFDPDRLPAIPGDGNSQCLTRCACEWEIVERWEEGNLIGWDCYWHLGAAETHCPDCQERASAWAPYTITV